MATYLSVVTDIADDLVSNVRHGARTLLLEPVAPAPDVAQVMVTRLEQMLEQAHDALRDASGQGVRFHLPRNARTETAEAYAEAKGYLAKLRLIHPAPILEQPR